MYLNILYWLLMVAVTLFFGWLVVRAWRSRNAIVKWAGSGLGGLLALIITLLSVATLVGLVKIYAPRNVPVPEVKIANTPEQIARGKHLANAFCVGCHSSNNQMPMVGGVDFGREIPIPLGSFVSENLTPAGVLKDYSDGELMRLLRSGVASSGQATFAMSIIRVRNMSDEDIHALIAFLRSQEPVPSQIQKPADQYSLLAVMMTGAGMMPPEQKPVVGVVTAPPKAPTAEYGMYVLNYQDCRDCHGETLTGGTPGQLPPVGPTLRSVKGWTREQFIETMRTGITPTGHKLGPQMPWQAIGRLDDDELTAAYTYLISLP